MMKSSPWVVTFSSVTQEQLRALERHSADARPRRVSLVSFSQAGSVYADEIAASVGSFLPRQEAPLRSPLSRPEDVSEFVGLVQKARVDLVLGAVAEPIADHVVEQLRRIDSIRAILFSPPRVALRARIAARLVVTALREAPGDPRRILDLIQRSPLVDRDFRTVALNWNVTDIRSKYATIELKSIDTYPCTCASQDGQVVRRCECLKDERCEKAEARDTCKVGCRR
jgi:hypothetical protein